jgi:hypothetical protein
VNAPGTSDLDHVVKYLVVSCSITLVGLTDEMEGLGHPRSPRASHPFPVVTRPCKQAREFSYARTAQGAGCM